MTKLYDETDINSIEQYARNLIGRTFLDIIKDASTSEEEFEELKALYGNNSRKGGLGNLIEALYFGYDINGNQEADFNKVGLELKATPYEIRKNGKKVAGERLVITMIGYDKPFEEDFFKSHVWDKLRLELLIHYYRNKALNSNLLYKIDYVTLYSPNQEDLIIIRHDYEIIKEKVMSGKAHELSESDTMYLGACTKGSTAIKSTVAQYYNPDVPARKRAFCLKVSYMTFVLQTYVLPNATNRLERLIDTLKPNQSFEEIIMSRLQQYIGKADKELCALLDREYNNNKAQWVNLCYKMLGIKGNKAEEFEKANVAVKSLRITRTHNVAENMSFSPFLFKEFAEETYETSEFYNYFEETRFLFSIWKENEEGTYTFVGAMFWNMPYKDLNEIARLEWEAIHRVIVEGVKFEYDGRIVHNNLPKQSNSMILHIRPHATKAAYKFDNVVIGNVNRDANELPNGDFMTTQSFWLSKPYIYGIVKEYDK